MGERICRMAAAHQGPIPPTPPVQCSLCLRELRAHFRQPGLQQVVVGAQLRLAHAEL